MSSMRRALAANMRLAIPIIGSQIAVQAMMATDVAMVGRLGEDALAANGLAAAFFATFVICGSATVGATSALAAQALGARNDKRVSEVVGHGFWAALILAAPIISMFLFSDPLLRALGQDPDLARMASSYLVAVSPGVLFALGNSVFRGFFAAVGRPRIVLLVNVVAVPANALLDYVFIFGRLGAPAMGVAGSGFATALVLTFSFMALAAASILRRDMRVHGVLRGMSPLRPALLLEVFRFGMPVGGAILLEIGFFAFASVMMGWIGTTALAAHNVAMLAISVAFMLAVGIGSAATALVGRSWGAGDLAGARSAGWAALGLVTAVMGGVGVAMWVAGGSLARLLIAGGEGEEVIALTASLLAVAALFQVADGVQSVAASTLRGLGDVRAPFIFAIAGYWGVGAGTGAWLAFVQDLGAVGVWLGFVAALVAVATALTARFALLVGRQGAKPSIPALGA